MSAQYMPLQGGPAPHNERSDVQTDQSSAGNKNECLKPGELARVVQYDPIVKVVPMRAGWESSTIEVKRSVLPNARYPFAVLESWIAISYVLICSNVRFLSPNGWAVGLSMAAGFSPPYLFCVLFFLNAMRSLLFPIIWSIHVLCCAIIQLILSVKCYREERKYFVGTLFALITIVLYGSFTIFVMYSHCYEAGEAALAVVAAAESGTAAECSESCALPALPYSQPAGGTAQDLEQNMESSQSCPQPSQVTDLGTVRVVRHDPIIRVFPFGGGWESSCIIVRRSVLSLTLRRVALLLHLLWVVIPIVIFIAGLAASGTGVQCAIASGITIEFTAPFFLLLMLDSEFCGTGSRDLFVFVKCVVSIISLQLAVTVASCHEEYFAQSLGAFVLLVLFGMVSIVVVYQHHYQAGKVALDALAAERARSSPEDDDSHECGSASKMTSR